ncbi:histidine kinase [Rhizobium ruizarguesonis]|jgi:hypothetical protein|uniref:Histidine kinase n=1 Tax=Rhizobium ruizarguesonis TaxID=2081791 RepID=A0AB38IAR8_9HYPH|nr:histidine kinase [Rhizobium ruizarguesonis]TCA25144.1 histidine kinase [Rhizobium leguminosarum bv. viciae]NEI03879.1 histidine kinase [Rhizobium ruizarguesonis]NEI26664.1 histidine kinase [Rhizobium ruizarguesonis]TAY96538.1 histidine kinase [Rhizobium ruizarguesonis]TAZ80920.1 histidine kinase [Rhizobium ruizarguesonis]
MKKLFLAVALAAFLPAVCEAATLEFPSDEPIASITIPDSWGPKETASGIDATSDDSAVYLSIDVADDKSSDKVIEDVFAFLDKNGVKIDESSQKESDGELNGMPVKNLDWDGTDKEGSVNIGLSILSPGAGKLLLVTYWGSKGTQEKHQSELIEMISTLKPAG